MGWMAIRLMAGFLAAVFLIMAAPGWPAEPDAGLHIYPLPLTEAEHVVIGWLQKSAFQVYRHTGTNQDVVLSADHAECRWQVVLRRHSPLATRIQVEVVRPEASGHPALPSLWQHIENYIRDTGRLAHEAAPPIPVSVRVHQSSVVCIYATAGEGADLQITGFVVDARGLIVCTGHDIDADQALRVQLADGRKLDGHIIKYDAYRDLMLVKVGERLITAVPLHNGRRMLRAGDRLYAITCAGGVEPGFEPGYLEDRPRRLAGLPLWQVKMHIAHGSSGSPVFDEQGHLAAVVKGRFRGTDTIGFLIPLETLLQFLEEY